MLTEVDTGPPTSTTIEGISEGIGPFSKIKKSREYAGYGINSTPARHFSGRLWMLMGVYECEETSCIFSL